MSQITFKQVTTRQMTTTKQFDYVNRLWQVNAAPALRTAKHRLWWLLMAFVATVIILFEARQQQPLDDTLSEAPWNERAAREQLRTVEIVVTVEVALPASQQEENLGLGQSVRRIMADRGKDYFRNGG